MDAIRRKIRQSWVYTAARRAQLEWRMIQKPDRALPDFLIIGVHKGGTSSLYANLTTHPNILPAWTKEVHYFDQTPLPRERWYRAHFPSKAELTKRNAITGEATPSYCLLPHVAERVKRTVPDAKMIMMLRDPVGRAYSAFQFNQRRGSNGQTFEDWIARDFDLIGDRTVGIEEMKMWLGEGASQNSTPLGLLRGLYITQIKHWHSLFPREQIKIVDSADYFRDPPAFLNDTVTQTFGLPPHAFAYQKTYHEKRGYPDMKPDTQARLQAFFKPYNEELYAYLGRDFGW